MPFADDRLVRFRTVSNIHTPRVLLVLDGNHRNFTKTISSDPDGEPDFSIYAVKAWDEKRQASISTSRPSPCGAKGGIVGTKHRRGVQRQQIVVAAGRPAKTLKMFNVPRQIPAFNMAIPVQPVASHPPQPFPQFCVLRPDRTAVPLIALDELPSWLQVGNWDWSDPTLLQSMVPASLSQIPRVGEYDVVCHHCCANLDIVQRSISQESDSKSSARIAGTDDFRPPSTYPGASRAPSRGLFPTSPVPLGYQRYSLFGEPPFLSNLQNPYVGLCLIDTRVIERGFNSQKSMYPQFPNCLLPTGSTNFASSQKDRKPSLNPEAVVFDPKSNKHSSTSSDNSGNCGGTIFSRGCASTSISSFPSSGRKDVERITRLPGPLLPKRGASDHLSASSTDVRSYPVQDLNAAVGQLKEILGIGKDTAVATANPTGVVKNGPETTIEKRNKKLRDEQQFSNDADNEVRVGVKLLKEETNHDVEKGIQSKGDERRRGEKSSGGPSNGGKAPPGRRRSRRRRQGRNPNNGEANRDRGDGPSRQENSSTKRQWRREKINRNNKNEYGPGSRYWHMMMIPNWRVKVPQRY